MVLSCCRRKEAAADAEDLSFAKCFPPVTLAPHELRTATQELKKGVQFIKFNQNGTSNERFLSLDRDQTRLTYFPSQKTLQDTTVYISDIVKILQGEDGELPDTAAFRAARRRQGLQATELAGVHCFAIVYKVKTEEFGTVHKTLNLGFRAPADSERRGSGEAVRRTASGLEMKARYQDTITFLVHKAHKESDVDPELVEMLELWMVADKDNDKRLSLSEIYQLLRGMQVDMDKALLKKKFDAADQDGSGQLSFEEFREFYNGLTHRRELHSIFDQYTTHRSKRMMEAEDLADFLEQCQCDPMHSDDALLLVRHIAGDNRVTGLTFGLFTRFLCSKELNGWFKPHQRERVHQNMNLPLHHYYINTSHNTMLAGDQIGSRASVEMYSKALQSGARCLEVHVYEGMDDNCLYVFHGSGLKIRVESVFQAIEENAFLHNPYPVIIALYVFIKDERQQIMLAKVMRECFGTRLAVISDECRQSDAFSPHPEYTPNNLMGKVVVMSRMAWHQAYHHKRPDYETDDEKEEPPEIIKSRAAQLSVRERAGAGPGAAGAGGSAQVPISEELSDAFYVRSTKLRIKQTPADQWAENKKPHEVAHLSESQCQPIWSAVQRRPGSFAEVNRRMLVRVYPAANRTQSDNYLPNPYWAHGVSMVALNFQKLDYPVRVNAARFQANGGCGFLLKPEQLRKGTPGAAPKWAYSYKLRVRVISGVQLLHSVNGLKGDIVDPYVAVWIYGVDQDCTPRPGRTKTVHNNGFNPVWDETFEFPVRCLELGMLTLRVYDSNEDEGRTDEAVGEATIGLTALRLGYRAVPLLHIGGPRHGQETPFSRLMCQFSLHEC
eukprot:TRINITY_DN50949_c0_g1_i1.p1 TRINITY_DN50949_c0_g1~~TRINITY_DN50949_c0_g1_i1.p1  ORF type:complete len:866 (+),score=334.46 TRINITY_DN50949_c0_g1_i1:92-2599(+)